MEKLLIAIIAVMLLGCSAAGVPYTSNPNTKLSYAYQLKNTEGRGLAAEKLGLEALSSFKAQNDNYGVAEAHIFLGLFYKNSAYRYHKEFYISQGEYDPTASKSISHLQKAKDAFILEGDYWGVSKALFVMGNSYASDNDYINSCKYFKESLKVYKSDKNIFTGRVHPHNPKYESFESMVTEFKDYACQKI
ncbi:hypothetical protein [Shewanella maritima]|uniref:hypothetical protein n=1 Tax=Shewanella maritima TaxID=2520507 RepID=UPI003735C50C